MTKLISSFAKFVQGDIKGGVAAHAFRLSQIANAIEQTLKGNYDPMREASTLASGKAKKARAYAAGFQAIATGVSKGEFGAPTASGQLERVAYVGALSLPENKGARDTIATHAATALRLFDDAFGVVMAEKVERKEKAPAPAPAPAPVADTADRDDTAAELVTSTEVEVDVLVDTLCGAISMGALSPEQVEMIRLALATMPAAVEQAEALAA